MSSVYCIVCNIARQPRTCTVVYRYMLRVLISSWRNLS